MKNLILFLATMLLFDRAMAANQVAVNANPKPLVQSCGKSLEAQVAPSSYSAIARKHGLRYLVLRVKLEKGRELMAQGQSAMIDVPELNPLRQADSGKWAHQMMSDNDSIGMGVRYKAPSDWKIGFVFPVEILDQHPFSLTHSMTLKSRQRALSFGRGEQIFKSGSSSHEEFDALMEAYSTFEEFPWSFNAHNPVQIHFDSKISLKDMAFIWVPRPVLTGEDMTQRIAANVEETDIRSLPEGWRRVRPDYPWVNLKPPVQNDLEFLAPDRPVGTWFQIVPDWSVVEAALKDSRRRNQGLDRKLLSKPR